MAVASVVARSCGCGTRRTRSRGGDDDTVVNWSAEHDGYARLRPSARHRRSVRLDRRGRSIEIIDEINGGSHDVRLAFHLGPDVQATSTTG